MLHPDYQSSALALPPRITWTRLLCERVCHSCAPSASRVMTLCPKGFLCVHKPPTSRTLSVQSASLLTASVPGLRFWTRVWWTHRDALLTQADIQSSMWTGINPECEQTGESGEKKQTGGYYRAATGESEPWVSPFGSRFGFDMWTKQTTRSCFQVLKPSWFSSCLWEGLQIFMPKCHTVCPPCCVKQNHFGKSVILLRLSQDPSASARRPHVRIPGETHNGLLLYRTSGTWPQAEWVAGNHWEQSLSNLTKKCLLVG